MKIIDNKLKENDFPHIGKLINLILYQSRIKKKEVALYLGLNSIAMSSIVKKQSIQAEMLWKISRFTNHNFFGYLSEKIKIPYQTDTEKELKVQIIALQKEIYDLQKENQLLKEIVKR